MKKSKVTRSLLAAVSIVALSVAVSACVHNGGSDTATDDTDLEMPDPAVAERTAITNAISTARTAVGMVNDTATNAQVTAANNAITAARTAITNATNVPAEERTAHTGTVNAIAGTLTTNLASRTKAMNTANTTAAKDALALFKSFTDTVGTTTVADVLTVTVTAVSDTDDGGGSAKVTGTGVGTTDGDAAGPGVGGQEVVRTAEPMLGMWQGTMLTDADTPGNSSTVVVYTDVEANTGKAFAAVYATETPAYNGRDSTTVANLLDSNANAAIVATPFSTGGLKNHPANNAAGDMFTISGTFDGAQGVYSCTPATGTACTSNLTSDGVVLAGGGGWSFDPVDTARVSQPDANYAYFGWWLNKTAGGSPEVDVFHGSNQAVDISSAPFTALGDGAIYKGPAVGKYAMNRGADQYASGGHWTANATLTANFEDPTQTGADIIAAAGSISGMIDGFMAGGESMDWSVKLNSTPIAVFDTAHDFGVAAEGTVWTIGGAAAAAGGSWEGDFHNQVAPPDGNNVPGTVTGEFSAVYGAVGHMVGAFGAHVEE